MLSACFSCGRVCAAPRTPAHHADPESNSVHQVWVGPDCYARAVKAGADGWENPKTLNIIFARRDWAEAWLDGENGQ